MEQHQNQENDFSGFMGATGGTGGPGAPGSFGGPANPITYPASTPLSPDELNAKVRTERINMFVGFTGAAGLPGNIQVNEHGQVTSPVSPEDEAALNEKVLVKIDTMGPDELKNVIVTNTMAINAATADVDAHNGNRAYTVGKALLRVEYILSSRTIKNGFETWCSENLIKPRISKRTRGKYMDIARIADALDYVVLGIEKLAALSTVLKRFDNLDPQHPIRDFTMRYNINLMECPDVEEMRFEIGLGITMAKLEQNDIPGVDKDCVRKFLETGFVLEKRDLEAMKAIHDAGGDPAKYLEKIIETQKRPTVSGSLNTRTLSKNIMEQAQEIRDTVAELLKAPKITGDINIDRIDALIQDLNALKLRLGVTPPSETTPLPSQDANPSEHPEG